MHLRSIKLRGFKSFPDPIEVKLEPGVAVVVGPNGSGKSNVSDAIVWAAGSLTPSELRAEKPDDVLFGGSATRQSADHCEVELVFDNEDGGFGGELDFSEISIARRLVRGGEGQYLVNRAPVRRTDLVELLADVGLGGSMHSIVSQGKVDAVLASKPEDRRALVEEAAGLGKFKRRRHRAELKLARVATQVERARDVEEEVRKRLRPLALQATAAERAEKLAARDRGAARTHRPARPRGPRGPPGGGGGASHRRRARPPVGAGAAPVRPAAERESAENELSDAAGAREAALGALYRLQGAGERLALRGESARCARRRGCTTTSRRPSGPREARTDETVRALEEAARTARRRPRVTRPTRSGHAAERARHAHALLAAAERAIADEAERQLEDIRRERERGRSGPRRADGRARRGQPRARRARRGPRAASRAPRDRRRRSPRRSATSTRPLGRTRAAVPRRRRSSSGARTRPAPRRALPRRERDDLAERARSARERLAALERSLAEREGIAPAARALAAEGERLALAALEVEPGLERAVAAALAWRASAAARDGLRARAGAARACTGREGSAASPS